MKVQLFTSLTGLNNRMNGKKSFAFTEESTFRNEIDNIVILVDFDEIESVEDTGLITLKEVMGRS